MMEEYIIRLYPTSVRLPMWARPLTIRRALIRGIKISEPDSKQISSEFSLRGLIRSPYKPEYPLVLNTKEILGRISEEITVDGVEVVEWMRISAAENLVLQSRISEYNRLGSQLIGTSGDPYIPGVSLEDIRYVSQTGSTVSSQGYAIVSTPRGNFNIPSLRKMIGVFRDLISWGSVSWIGSVQFTGSLLKWKSLAETPITQSVGFYMDAIGNVAPNFFTQKPTRPALSIAVRQVFSSDRDQVINVRFRDPTDYSNIVGSKRVAITAGTNEVTYTISAFPYVPPLIAEIQPEDNKSTKLEAYTVG